MALDHPSQSVLEFQAALGSGFPDLAPLTEPVSLRWAKFLSTVISPPFTFLIACTLLGTAISNEVVSQGSQGFRIGVLGGLFPLVLLVVLKRVGHVHSLELDTLEERVYGFLLALLGGFLCLWIFSEGTAGALNSFIVCHLAVTSLFLLITIMTMPRGWKMSVHCGSAAYLIIVGLYTHSTALAVCAAIGVILVGWSRLHLNRHSLSEISFGTALSVVVGSLLLL